MMNVQYALLGFLGESPNYGYELKKIYDKLFGKDKPVLPGQIYSTLGRLRRDGKVQEIKDAGGGASGGPDRVKYAITPNGESVLQAWLDAPERPAPQLQATLYIKTVLALIRYGEAARFLDNQRHAHIERMRQLTRQRQGGSVANMLVIDHAIFHLEADLRWIDLTSSRLIKLKEEICL
jgi:DNA-binding PadR family transcriptional regulator